MKLTGTNSSIGLIVLIRQCPFPKDTASNALSRPGGHCEGPAPDPMPNSAVKSLRANDTSSQDAGKSVAARSAKCISLFTSSKQTSFPNITHTSQNAPPQSGAVRVPAATQANTQKPGRPPSKPPSRSRHRPRGNNGTRSRQSGPDQPPISMDRRSQQAGRGAAEPHKAKCGTV